MKLDLSTSLQVTHFGASRFSTHEIPTCRIANL